MADEVTNEQVNQIVSAWGGDYLPAEENPPEAEGMPDPVVEPQVAPTKADTKTQAIVDATEKALAGAEKPPETTDEPKVEDEAKVDPDPNKAEADPAKQEVAAKPEPKEDSDLARRLALIDSREAQFRNKERETKAAIEAQVQKLENLYAEIEKREASQKAAEKARRDAYNADPMKVLADNGLSFEAIAAANLKAKGLPIPEDLRQLVAQDAMKPARLKDELGEMIDARLGKILEKLDSRDQQVVQSQQQQQQQLVVQDMRRAVDFVAKNTDAYPFLSTFLGDPENLANQMLSAREEIFQTTGNMGDIGTAARYVEKRYADQFHPVFGRVKPTGQPSASSDTTSSAERKGASETRTLSNEAGADRVTNAPVDMDEEYERLWKQAPAFLRGS